MTNEERNNLRPYTVIVGVGEQTGTPDPMGADVAIDELWAESVEAAKAEVFEECEPDEDGDMVDTDGSPVSIRAIYAGHHQDLRDKPADAPESCFWVVGKTPNDGVNYAVAVAANDSNDALNRFEEAVILAQDISREDEAGIEEAESLFDESIYARLQAGAAEFALPADLSLSPDEPVITQSVMERARKAAQAANDEPTPGSAT